MKKTKQYCRIENILGDIERLSFVQTIDIFFDFLQKNLTLPCLVTGIKDFEWEEYYVFGSGSKKEYQKQRKNQPSYADIYELYNITRNAKSEWTVFKDDIGAHVKRLSDGKKFILGLSELKTPDRKARAYQLLDDYSIWFYQPLLC